MTDEFITHFIITATNIISCFGICLIVFYIGLIVLSRKNKTVEGYFSAVANNSVFDFLYSIVIVIAKIDCRYINGFAVFALHRFDYEINPFLTRIIAIGHIFTGHMCLYVVCIPFYIRYSLICKKQNASYGLRILLYLFAVASGIITSSILYMVFHPSPPELVGYQMRSFLKGNDEGKYWNFVGAEIVSLRFFSLITKQFKILTFKKFLD